MTPTLEPLDIFDILGPLHDMVKARHEQAGTLDSLKGKSLCTLRSSTPTKTPDVFKKAIHSLNKGETRPFSDSAHEKMLFKAKSRKEITEDRFADAAPHWDDKIISTFNKAVDQLRAHPAFGSTSSLTIMLGLTKAGRPTFGYYPEGIIPDCYTNLVTRDAFLLRLNTIFTLMDVLTLQREPAPMDVYASHYSFLITAPSAEMASLKYNLLSDPANPKHATAVFGNFSRLADQAVKDQAAKDLTQDFRSALDFHLSA